MTRKPNHPLKNFVLMIAFMPALLTACSAVKEPLPVTEQPSAVVSPVVSPTSVPSNTPAPSPTTVMTATITLEPTVTPSPTPVPPSDDFSTMKLFSFGYMPDWRFMWQFQFSAPVKGDYFVQTKDPQKTYPCRPLTEYRHPERLVCLGDTPAIEKTVEYSIIDSKTGAVLYSGSIAVPFK
jgi:hypothetical protein